MASYERFTNEDGSEEDAYSREMDAVIDRELASWKSTPTSNASTSYFSCTSQTQVADVKRSIRPDQDTPLSLAKIEGKSGNTVGSRHGLLQGHDVKKSDTRMKHTVPKYLPRAGMSVNSEVLRRRYSLPARPAGSPTPPSPRSPVNRFTNLRPGESARGECGKCTKTKAEYEGKISALQQENTRLEMLLDRRYEENAELSQALRELQQERVGGSA